MLLPICLNKRLDAKFGIERDMIRTTKKVVLQLTSISGLNTSSDETDLFDKS